MQTVEAVGPVMRDGPAQLVFDGETPQKHDRFHRRVADWSDAYDDSGSETKVTATSLSLTV